MFKVKKGFTVIEIAIVIAIVAILAGVWYMSKNKAGADIRMPGIGTTGTTGTSGNTTPPNMTGTIKGQVTLSDGTPAIAGGHKYTIVHIGWGKCNSDVIWSGAGTEFVLADEKGFYKTKDILPGSYCGYAEYNIWGKDNIKSASSPKKDIGVLPKGITTINFKLSDLKPLPVINTNP